MIDSAFWCYVHADDHNDQGRILQLAWDIQNEFAAITADLLDMTVDRKDLVLGHHWRELLDDAIRKSTFMICIVTPRFFTSAECRSEVEPFSALAERLGRSELLLPIFYIDVPDLDTNGSDPIRALINRAHREDWRDLRLLDRSSSAYRSGVNRIVKAIQKRKAELADVAHRTGIGTRRTSPDFEVD